MDESLNSPDRSLGTRGGMLRVIFVGRDGVRAGWRALAFIAIYAGAAYGLEHFARHFAPPLDRTGAIPATTALVEECVQVAAVTLATAVFAAIEGKSIFAYGLQGSARGMRFLAGLGCGFAAISALVLTLWQAGYLRLDASTIVAAQAWKSAATWALVMVMTGVFEETMLRGYLQHTLARGLGFWWAAMLLSLVFGGAHGILVPGESPVGVVCATLAGMLFCLTLWLTGSLWWAIGFHAAWDWGESYFYGTPDSGELAQGTLFAAHPSGNVIVSGGVAGPEGSVLVFVVFGAVAVLAWAWWGRRRRTPAGDRGWAAR